MTTTTANKAATNKPVTKPVTAESKPEIDERIPAVLSKSLLAEFCKQYLSVVDEINGYNKEVLAERTSDWNAGKVLEKAREFARPTDKDTKPKDEIKTALETYENLVNETARARKTVLDITSKELGITLSAVADRNPETEGPLKEKRKLANEIGNQLTMMAGLTQDKDASASISKFLEDVPLPAVGRDQVRTFGNDGKSTPKYRVTVVVTDSDGNTKLSEDGFTKTALALTKFYERGKAPKSEDLRKAWENAGNTPDKTVTNPVEFDDNNLHFTISKKS